MPIKKNTYGKDKTNLTPPLTLNDAPKTQIDTDLQAIIDNWNDLPEHIKQTIKMLANSASTK